MKNTKLFALLQTFTKAEFREFGLFICSPHFNREKVLSDFYKQLKKYHPGFSSPKLKKQILFSCLFPGKKYNDALMRNTVSDLLKLSERFLKIRHFENMKFYGQYLLLKELTNRGQSSLFKTNFRLANKFLESDTARDEIFYQNKFLIEDEWRRNHVVSSSKMLFESDNLDKQSHSLHVYYITEFIKLYAILLNQSRYTFDYKFDFALFEAVREYLENNFAKYRNIPYIMIFYNCVKLYLTGDEIYFNKLNKLLRKHFGILTLTDRKNIFIVLAKYCDEQLMKGDFSFYQKKFSIFENFLKTKAFYEGNDFMAHYIYESIALNAISCGRLGWAENFLIKYRNIVHRDFRERSYNICLAELLFCKGYFSKSLEALSLFIPVNVKERERINILLLKVFYKTNESESFDSLVASSRKYILRNKSFQEANKKQFANFLKFIVKLHKIINDDDLKHELNHISGKILACNELIAKKWLLDEVLQIKK